MRAGIPVPFKIEFDLHEWIPDMSFQMQSFAEVRKLQSEFEQCRGEWPTGETRVWETSSHMRERALAVLRNYLSHSRVLVVCHGTLIKSVSGVSEVKLAGLVPFDLKN